jgi:hypothetical protein
MTKPNPLPSLAKLNDLLDYDPETGLFTWKKTSSNRAVAGSIAGTLHRSGYPMIKINGKRYRSHRLAYKMFYGSDPVDQVDHIDCDKSNNKIANLRDATRSQNQKNRGAQKNNTSGFKGVSYLSKRKRWLAQIWYNHKKIYLGSYKTKEDAASAYEKAAKEHHGEFARIE